MDAVGPMSAPEPAPGHPDQLIPHAPPPQPAAAATPPPQPPKSGDMVAAQISGGTAVATVGGSGGGGGTAVGGSGGGGGQSPDRLLEKLREYVQGLGGNLEPGWRAEVRTRQNQGISSAGHTDVYYYCPKVGCALRGCSSLLRLCPSHTFTSAQCLAAPPCCV